MDDQQRSRFQIRFMMLQCREHRSVTQYSAELHALRPARLHRPTLDRCLPARGMGKPRGSPRVRDRQPTTPQPHNPTTPQPHNPTTARQHDSTTAPTVTRNPRIQAFPPMTAGFRVIRDNVVTLRSQSNHGDGRKFTINDSPS